MTSFVQPSFITQHQGVARIESAWSSARTLRRSFDGTRSLAFMLLAAMVSTLVVVADQLIDTWADGHLLAAWVAVWLVGFAGLALFAGAARRLAAAAIKAGNDWSARVAQSRADRRMWSIARSDPRVMSDLTAAMLRNERS